MLGTARDGILTGGLVVDSGSGPLLGPPEEDEADDIVGPDETRVGGVFFPGGVPPVSSGDGTQTGGDVVTFGGTRTVERTPRVGTQADDPDPGGFQTVVTSNVLACTSAREGG
ncbi:MAG: hypothetical protein GWO22_11405, partial [Actinobacteria bacterium]|nr:hypothetical protein [Actinomycetota bacterium]